MSKKHPHLAFDVEPARNRYRLRLARYPAMADAIETFVRERPGPDPLEILDVGAGSGRSLRYLEPRGLLPRLRFTAVDNDPHRFAKIHRPECWQLVSHDATRPLPFPDNRFDAVICEQVLEHLDDPASLLREIRRVMKPGALAVLGVPIFTPPHAALRKLWLERRLRKTGQSPSHLQNFTARSFRRLVAQNGLQVQSLRGFRIVSGGRIAFLENHHGWYRLNRRMGRLFPSLCIEVQILAHKPQPA